MNIDGRDLIGAIAVGVGATLFIDLWNLFLQRAFNVASLNYCLLGRWIRHMPRKFRHANIATVSAKTHECTVGWMAHYGIGVVFSVVFVALSPSWLARPTLLPVLLYGIATVVFPFFLLQPSLGFGVAAAKSAKPAQARLKSLMTHAAFGVGLYASAVGVRCLRLALAIPVLVVWGCGQASPS